MCPSPPERNRALSRPRQVEGGKVQTTPGPVRRAATGEMKMATPIKDAVLAAVAKCEASNADTCYRSFAFKQIGEAKGKPVYAIAGIELQKGQQPEVFVNVDCGSDLTNNADPKTDDAGVFDNVEIAFDENGDLTDDGFLSTAFLQQELAVLSGACKTRKRWALRGLFPETAE